MVGLQLLKGSCCSGGTPCPQGVCEHARGLCERARCSCKAGCSLGRVQVKIQGQNKEMLAAACQMFLGKSESEIAQIALETLEGHQRAIMAHMTVEVRGGGETQPHPLGANLAAGGQPHSFYKALPSPWKPCPPRGSPAPAAPPWWVPHPPKPHPQVEAPPPGMLAEAWPLSL